jgi:TPR repeat protein
VLVTPIFSRSSLTKAAAGAVFASLLWISIPANTRAEDSSILDFFSFLPAKPEISAPEIKTMTPWADDMKKARLAYSNGNFENARGYLEKASDEGDIVAAWYLGHIYRLGRGVPADTGKAFHYYSMVAERFTPDEPDPRRLRITIDALVRVADIYRTGDEGASIEPNAKAAFRLYTTAASYGHPAAHFAQGLMALKGQGVKANPDKALKWLFLAAKKRYPPAEALLGDLYWQGDVVKRDRTRALMWYVLATQSAKPEEYPEIFDKFVGLSGEAAEDQRLEAETRARVWAEKYPLPPPPLAAWPEPQT